MHRWDGTRFFDFSTSKLSSFNILLNKFITNYPISFGFFFLNGFFFFWLFFCFEIGETASSSHLVSLLECDPSTSFSLLFQSDFFSFCSMNYFVLCTSQHSHWILFFSYLPIFG